ncbi:hypothetical protein ABK046_47360, partial [Streptomyces caeruleatus]
TFKEARNWSRMQDHMVQPSDHYGNAPNDKSAHKPLILGPPAIWVCVNFGFNALFEEIKGMGGLNFSETS